MESKVVEMMDIYNMFDVLAKQRHAIKNVTFDKGDIREMQITKDNQQLRLVRIDDMVDIVLMEFDKKKASAGRIKLGVHTLEQVSSAIEQIARKF